MWMVEVWEDEKSEIEERFSFLGESFYANVTILYLLFLSWMYLDFHMFYQNFWL